MATPRIREGSRRDPVRQETQIGEQIIEQHGHPAHQSGHFDGIPNVTGRRRK